VKLARPADVHRHFRQLTFRPSLVNQSENITSTGRFHSAEGLKEAGKARQGGAEVVRSEPGSNLAAIGREEPDESSGSHTGLSYLKAPNQSPARK
jgi:hypothetical protein